MPNEQRICAASELRLGDTFTAVNPDTGQVYDELFEYCFIRDGYLFFGVAGSRQVSCAIPVDHSVHRVPNAGCA